MSEVMPKVFAESEVGQFLEKCFENGQFDHRMFYKHIRAFRYGHGASYNESVRRIKCYIKYHVIKWLNELKSSKGIGKDYLEGAANYFSVLRELQKAYYIDLVNYLSLVLKRVAPFIGKSIARKLWNGSVNLNMFKSIEAEIAELIDPKKYVDQATWRKKIWHYALAEFVMLDPSQIVQTILLYEQAQSIDAVSKTSICRIVHSLNIEQNPHYIATIFSQNAISPKTKLVLIEKRYLYKAIYISFKSQLIESIRNQKRLGNDALTIVKNAIDRVKADFNWSYECMDQVIDDLLIDRDFLLKLRDLTNCRTGDFSILVELVDETISVEFSANKIKTNGIDRFEPFGSRRLSPRSWLLLRLNKTDQYPARLLKLVESALNYELVALEFCEQFLHTFLRTRNAGQQVHFIDLWKSLAKQCAINDKLLSFLAQRAGQNVFNGLTKRMTNNTTENEGLEILDQVFRFEEGVKDLKKISSEASDQFVALPIERTEFLQALSIAAINWNEPLTVINYVREQNALYSGLQNIYRSIVQRHLEGDKNKIKSIIDIYGLPIIPEMYNCAWSYIENISCDFDQCNSVEEAIDTYLKTKIPFLHMEKLYAAITKRLIDLSKHIECEINVDEYHDFAIVYRLIQLRRSVSQEKFRVVERIIVKLLNQNDSILKSTKKFVCDFHDDSKTELIAEIIEYLTESANVDFSEIIGIYLRRVVIGDNKLKYQEISTLTESIGSFDQKTSTLLEKLKFMSDIKGDVLRFTKSGECSLRLCRNPYKLTPSFYMKTKCIGPDIAEIINHANQLVEVQMIDSVKIIHRYSPDLSNVKIRVPCAVARTPHEIRMSVAHFSLFRIVCERYPIGVEELRTLTGFEKFFLTQLIRSLTQNGAHLLIEQNGKIGLNTEFCSVKNGKCTYDREIEYFELLENNEVYMAIFD